MKTKTIAAFFVCVLAAAFLLGLTGTVQVAADADGDTSDGGRLIGAFVTASHLELFDGEAFIKDNMDKLSAGGEPGGDTAGYEGRLYATLADVQAGGGAGSGEYVFEDVDGIRFFAAVVSDESGAYTACFSDSAISDGRMDVAGTGDGASLTLEGTIYASTLSEARCFYVNPVYQTEDGRVYAVTGEGITMSGDLVDGMSHTLALTESRSTTVNGDTLKNETSVTVTVEYITPPERVRVVQLDADDRVAAVVEYQSGSVPDTITPEPGVEYIIVESLSAEGAAERELFQKNDGFLTALSCGSDGVCVKHDTKLEWP